MVDEIEAASVSYLHVVGNAAGLICRDEIKLMTCLINLSDSLLDEGFENQMLRSATIINRKYNLVVTASNRTAQPSRGPSTVATGVSAAPLEKKSWRPDASVINA